MTEEEDVQFWESSLDEGCSKEDAGAGDVCLSSTREYIGSPFLLTVQATDSTKKCTTFIIIQQVYKGSHEEHPRRKIRRGEMKFDPYLLIKIECPKLFEVEDQINHVLLIYDEPG